MVAFDLTTADQKAQFGDFRDRIENNPDVDLRVGPFKRHGGLGFQVEVDGDKVVGHVPLTEAD